jgi:hypothetical protein
MMRVALGAGPRLFTLEARRRDRRLRLAEPQQGLRRRHRDRRPGEGQERQHDRCRSTRGFPAYYAEARAFVSVEGPVPATVHPGEGHDGRGSALNVRALYQRCPHLGCKPKPVSQELLDGVARATGPATTDRIKADGPQYGPAAARYGSVLGRGRRWWGAPTSTLGRSRSARCPSHSGSPASSRPCTRPVAS